MSEWKTYTLGKDVVTKLGDGLHGTPIYDDNGEYYFINGSNLVDGKIVINSNTKKVTEEEFIKYKKELSDKTILLGINGTIGNVALYNNELCILGKSAAYLNINDDFDKQFIRYVLTNDHFQNYIKNNASGTTIKNVGLGLLREYEFSAPVDKAQQQEIAQILTSLDDKIELNLQMNQTLEAMAQALFKEWFVNFNFPNFDGELQNDLPKGWRMGSLSEIISFVVDNRGKTPNTLIEKENNYPLIEVNSLINSRVVTQQHLAKKYVDDETYNNWFRKGHPQKGDVLFSTVGSIGEISLVFDEKFCIAQNIIALRSIFNGSFLFFTLKNLKQSLLSLDISSVQPSIKVPHLLKSEILIPNEEIIKAYEESILPIIEKINENSIQIQTLTQTRDTLLPKLMTGKIEIRN